jgi:uncharacterized protein DUF4337
MDNPSELIPEAESKDRFNSWVAISVAILATFMAITKIKDDNLVQAMMQAKSDAVDTWSEYQATRIKHHLLEVGRDQFQSLLHRTPPKSAEAPLEDEVRRYEAQMARYQSEEQGLRKKARDFEAQYDRLNYRDDQFDLSDALMSVSIALLAVSALTHKKWLLSLAWVMGVLGAMMGMAGMLGWQMHPDLVMRLLS